MQQDRLKCYEDSDYYYVPYKNFDISNLFSMRNITYMEIEDDMFIVIRKKNKRINVIATSHSKDTWCRNEVVEYSLSKEIYVLRRVDYDAIKNGEKEINLKCEVIDSIFESSVYVAITCIACTEKKPIKDALSVFLHNVYKYSFADYSKDEDSIIPDSGTISDYFVKLAKDKDSSVLSEFIYFLSNRVDKKMSSCDPQNANEIFNTFDQEQQRQLADFTSLYFDEYESILGYELAEEYGNMPPECFMLGRIFLDERYEREANVKLAFLQPAIKNEISTLCDAIFRNSNERTIVVQIGEAVDARVFYSPNDSSAGRGLIQSFFADHYADGCFIIVKEHHDNTTEIYGIEMPPFDRWRPISSYEIQKTMTTLPNGKTIPMKAGNKCVEIRRTKW